MRYQRERKWKCDLKDCKSDGFSCFSKAYFCFSKEIYETVKQIEDYRMNSYPYCFCRRYEKWWEKFRPLYEKIINFERKK